jgi:hypothetical protein
MKRLFGGGTFAAFFIFTKEVLFKIRFTFAQIIKIK